MDKKKVYYLLAIVLFVAAGVRVGSSFARYQHGHGTDFFALLVALALIVFAAVVFRRARQM